MLKTLTPYAMKTRQVGNDRADSQMGLGLTAR